MKEYGLQISAHNEDEAIKKLKEKIPDADRITAKFLFVYNGQNRYDMRFKSNKRLD